MNLDGITLSSLELGSTQLQAIIQVSGSGDKR